MRLMIVVLVLVALVIIDQARFRGHYGSQISQFFARLVYSVT
jgi:hypothetical protein